MSEVFDPVLVQHCILVVEDNRCLLQTIRSKEQVVYLLRLFSLDLVQRTGFDQGDAFRCMLQAAEQKEFWMMELAHLF